MARKKSEFLSALGTMMEMWKVIVAAVFNLGGSDDDLRRILTDKSLPGKIAEVIVTGGKTVVKTWQELFHACQQSWVNSDFNEENFPLETVAPDEDEWEVYEHHFSEVMNGESAFRRLEELGYKLCGPRRAMEYIADHLDTQLNHPLVVTARWQARRGVWYAPIFYRHDGKRSLNLLWLGDGFNPNYGWLVLRKHRP